MATGTFRAEPLTQGKGNGGLVALQFLVASVGSVMLFSASWYFARTVFGDPFHIWRRQMIWMALGLFTAVILARIPKEILKRSVPFLVGVAVFTNILTYVPGIGYASGGAQRWIEAFGFTFQPSEFTRIALVLYLARILEKKEGRLDDLRNGLLPPFLVVLLLVFLVYFQNDFSTAAYLFIVSLGLFFAAGMPWKAITAIGFTGVLGGVAMLMARPYRIGRVRSWFRPYEDPSGAGYQLMRARVALERGGFWGQGLGRGTVKQGGLPAAHSDFVAAVIGEEAGLVGVLSVLVLFSLLAWKGWQAAMAAEDGFSRWGLFGLTASIYWQVLLNLAVVSGSVPATGIPLPLFSAGGSAAFITLAMFGLMVNLARSAKRGQA